MRVLAEIGSDETNMAELTFWVDTGSFYTILSPEVAHTAGIRVTVNTTARISDNRSVRISTGMAYVKVMEREAALPVGILDVPISILGVTAPDGLGLKVNPVGGILEYDLPFGPALLGMTNA